MRGTSNSACVLLAVLAAVSGAFWAVAALYAPSILGADGEQHTEASWAKPRRRDRAGERDLTGSMNGS